MSFTTTLLQWFHENGRQLPWRQTRDPYAIWLSEIILQQTRIEQGLPYWERFMQQWPTVEDLAAATEQQVLRMWQGLGYYSRARNLHQAARQIVAMGAFPNTLEGIRSLKGVGPYTAAAIGSIAFGLPAAVVDGNVFRLLARHYGISTPINTSEGRQEFTALAQSLLPHSTNGGNEGGEAVSLFNQAMMDFGAMICTPHSPHCTVCPLMETCSALRNNSIGMLPVKLKTLKVKERHIVYVYIRVQGQTAIRRRPAGDIWQGLYEPLFLEIKDEQAQESEASQASDSLSAQESEVCRALANLSPSSPRLSLVCQNVKHVLTHRVLYADFYLWEATEKPSLPEGYFWIDEADIDQYALPRLVDILLTTLHQHTPTTC